MKGLIKLALLAAVVAGLWYGWKEWSSFSVRDSARKRVDTMLEGLRDNSTMGWQTATGMWAKGVFMLADVELEAGLPRCEAFVAQAGLMPASEWSVSATETVDEDTALVTLSNGGSELVLEVTKEQPIRLSE